MSARNVQPGTDIVSGAGVATAKSNPDDPADIERHGTEMAGVIVGHGGPYGLRGIAPGATIFPVRVAGWQRDVTGGWAVYGRSDQLIAGLEAAVDPNADGDTHDAARIAVVGLAEPYISFADAPESRAVDGALNLDTLVVAPAGNDLPAGPAFGSISGPGGAAGALSVGAADLRSETEQVRVAVRSGLDIQLSRPLPLAGAFAPQGTLQLEVAAPHARYRQLRTRFGSTTSSTTPAAAWSRAARHSFPPAAPPSSRSRTPRAREHMPSFSTAVVCPPARSGWTRTSSCPSSSSRRRPPSGC